MEGLKVCIPISTDVAPLLIIKQGHWPMFITGRQEASLTMISLYPKPLITEISNPLFYKSDEIFFTLLNHDEK